MSETEETTPEATPPRGWRLRVGLALIVTSFLTPLLALLLPLIDIPTAAKATLGGLLMAGIPEVFTVAAVAVMGKSGFAWVKGKAFGFLKRHGPREVVSRTRYRIGLAMLILPMVYAWVAWYMPESLPGLPEYRLEIGVAMDLIFWSAFLVLGGRFWDKVRALFVYEARADFPPVSKDG